MQRRGVEVIPLQNCFGHCEYILQHERYRALREDPKDPSQVCPLKIAEATACFSELFAEVASLHPSKYFHIGADETYLLGLCGNCRAVADREGKSRLFVDYVKAMCDIVHRLGKTPVIWADIILKYPEALDELPDDLIFVDWNYGWEPDRFGKLANLFSRGVKLWGAPALRSGPDNIYLTQWKKHFDNLAVFVEYAREHDYGGMIETSWSTSGTYGYWFDNGYEILSMRLCGCLPDVGVPDSRSGLLRGFRDRCAVRTGSVRAAVCPDGTGARRCGSRCAVALFLNAAGDRDGLGFRSEGTPPGATCTR